MVYDAKKYIVLTLFMLAVFSVHVQLLSNGFINYDDQPYVTANQIVQQGLTLEGMAWAFTTSHSYNWHPLTWLSHMLDVQLYGLNPMGHHLTNLLLHMANSLLLFVVIGSMTGAFWRSLCVAALFALHPQHVESVAWIAERKDLLSTLFGFLAILYYLKFTRSGKVGPYLGVVFLLAAGLMAKPMLVTLPFVLLLLDYWPLGRVSRTTFARLVLEKVPLLALAAASSAVTYAVQSREGAVNLSTPASLNIGNALISYVRYIGKMFWPHPLAVIYPFNPDDINLPTVLGSAIFLAVTTYLLMRGAKRRPWLAVGWLWFLGTLVPVIGLVRVGDHSIADRYTYLPSVGLFILVVWGVDEIREILRMKKAVIGVLALAVIGILSALTMRQEKYWSNSITLFEHAVSVTDDNSAAHKMLGLAHGARGNAEKATSEGRISRMLYYRYVIKINPDDHAAHFMLANAYSELGQFNDAIREYQASIRLNGNNSKAYNNLGIAYYNVGNIDDAKRAFRMAVTIEPGNTEALSNLNRMERQFDRHGQ